MTKDEALRLALEALESGIKTQANGVVWIEYDCELVEQAITAIKAALEAKDEAWECVCGANLYIDANGIPRSKASVEPATVMFKPEQEAKDEPVAWDGYNLDDMCEAFNRVIEEHFHRKHPFHDPVNNDAMIALRILRGFIPYMKRHTTPPQRKPLTLEQLRKHWKASKVFDMTYAEIDIADYVLIARDVEALHGIKGEA